jgi:extracellular matrix regulatory protein A
MAGKSVLHTTQSPVLQVGGNNFVSTERIVGVFEPDTAAVKRLIREAKATNKLVDVSRHREVHSVLILDTGGIITTYLTPEDLAARLGGRLSPISE